MRTLRLDTLDTHVRERGVHEVRRTGSRQGDGSMPETAADDFPRTQFSSSSHVVFNEQHEDEVRAIGEKLDKLGGMRCMRKVGEAFARELPIHARKLETMWDGIGYWMC